MLTIERRQEIRKYLLEHKSASVKSLAEIFQVSGQTIRRDFSAMEQEGFLVPTHGGAILKARKSDMQSNEVKRVLFSEEKQRICRAAAELIYSNDCIYIDHSTTLQSLCPLIEQMPLQVLTNSVKVVGLLAKSKTINLIATGGQFHNELDGFFGIETMLYLQQHCVDKAIISCRSLDLRRGISDADELTAGIRKAVIQNAEETILLADHTKFDKSGFSTICDFDAIDYLVTDQPLHSEWQEKMAVSGVKVIVAD